MCKYSDGEWKCPHENLPDSGYCIFHLKDENKDIEEFNKGINRILESEEDSINFNGFYFPPDTTDFKNVTFKGYADFKDAEFGGYADFSNTKFKGTADFRNAKFKGEATFFYAVIGGYAIFIDVIFSKKVNFTNVTFKEKFEGHADFFKAEFKGKAYFNDVKFERNANFKRATFEGKTYFRQATFKGDANFDNAELIGKFLFIPIKSETIIFKNTYFSDNVRIKADMSKCSFVNSNIERVDMTDSSWMRDDKPNNSLSALFEWFKNRVGLSKPSIIIWEEHQGELKSNWKELEGIYRRLKQSYQKSGDYGTAGKFYFQEMECIRKQLGYFHRQFQNVFYRGLCGHGEKPFNVVLISIIIIFAFAISYFYYGIEINEAYIIDYNLSSSSFDFSWTNDFLWSLYTSIITFTTLGYGDVHPIGWSRVFASIESLIGIFMTALFIFVFTRKMIR